MVNSATKRGKSDAGAKFKFMQRLLADPALSPSAKCVALSLLVIWRNSKTGQCNPSLGTIAKTIGLARRTVIDAIAELKRSNWVEVDSTGGGSWRNTNYYKFDFSCASSVSSKAPLVGADKDAGAKSAPVQKMSVPVQKAAHEPLKNPSPFQGEGEGENSRRRAPDSAPPEEEDFGEFWQLWQRGHGDDGEKVRKAFARAVAEHGADHVLASARRWAAAREPQYLPEPVKWLAGGWQSEPSPKRSGRNGDRGSFRRSKVNPVMEALRAGGFDVDERDA
jgi:Helix-turn-helix domain